MDLDTHTSEAEGEASERTALRDGDRERSNTRAPPTSARSRRGGHSIEFAITLPVFLLFMLGTIDFGYAYYASSAVSVAVTDGCREGSLVDPGFGEEDAALVTTAATEAIVAGMASLGLDCEGCSPEARLVDAQPSRSLYCSLDWAVPSLVGVLFDQISLSASTSTRLEWQR